MNRLRLVAVLALFVLTSLTAHAVEKPFRLDPSKPMSQYVLATWTDATGLPVDSISGLAQTPDGYVWASTEHGLVRFDGVRFTLFTTANTPQLRTNDIYTLFASRNGTLWIGTRGSGAVTFDGTHFARVPIRYRFIIGFAESPDGSVWIAAPAGITRIRDGKIKTFEKAQGYPGGRIEAIAADATGAYLAMPSGILRIDDKGVRSWTNADGLSGPVHTLHWGSRGLLAGTANGVDRLVGNRFEPLFRTPPTQAITSILEGGAGSLWMSTIGGGLLRFANGKLDALTQQDGLPNDSLNQVIEDDEGNLWVGTTGGGLVRLAEGSITSILPPSVKAEWILALIRARDGSIWFTTNAANVCRMNGNTITQLTAAEGLRGSMITSFAEDQEGTIWIGSDAGLQRVVGNRIVPGPGAADGLEGTFVQALAVTRDGALWISTEAGLHRMSDGRARKLTEKDGMRRGLVVAIREASDGSLWFAKPNAVEHYVDGKIISFSVEQGVRSQSILSLTLDEHDGSIWIPTMGSGLIRINDDRVTTYRSSDGLLSDSMYVVVQDYDGNLWISTGLGLFKIRRSDLEAFDAGRAASIITQVFRKADGLKTNDFSGGFDNAGWRAPDGKLWFPTTRGLAVINPDTVHVDLSTPVVRIESILAHNTPYTGGVIDLPASERELEIAYTAPSFHAPESTTFRYRLEGFDQKWQNAGTRRTAFYTNLPPGKYRFVVEATTRAGNSAQAAMPIEIAPKFYETQLFKLAIGLLLLLIAWMAHRVRVANLHRHQEALRRSEEHFRSLIENAPDMILVIEPNHHIGYASPSVSRVLGLAPEDMKCRALGDFLVSSEAGEVFLERVERAGRHAASMRFRDGAGAEREIEATGARSHEDDGRIVLNCRDITDRQRLEAQLAQANRLSSLGRLAATVSHEFNNVLMGVQPFVDIIRRRSDDSTIQHAAQQMRRSVERGKRITEQILRYTRPAEPALRAVMVRDWLLEVELEIRALLGPNVRPVIIAPPALGVEADVAQLNQVLANLAINARDAGATRIAFEVALAEGNGVYSFGIVPHPESYVHLTIRDNGTGIPESVLPHVFEPLFTTKTTKGTGLGLAVAQQVVAKHGGEIFVESRVGSGTAFHLFLRRAAIDTIVEESNTTEIAVNDTPRCRVLLVEDDSAIADGILSILESEGFEIELAVSGGDALHHIARFGPDVVVLDVGLPDMSGIEVYRRMMKQWPELPVIFSTGHADLAMLQETLPPPHPQCLLKPYEIDTLIAAIAEALSRIVHR
jgi:PAS domain S-box-containing protein